MEIQDDFLYDNAEASAYLSVASNTLRNSRSHGKLAGVTAPAFIKLGSTVRYKGSTLKAWREQFEEKTAA